jgi:phytoene dehydrogenase-like protein
MNGFQAQIFELHDKPGGLCTSWKRKDYIIDGCLHWLVGSSPTDTTYKIWQELGAVQGRKFIDHDIFMQVKDSSGKTLTLYTDVNRLEKHLLELSPGDEKVIKSLTAAVRKFCKMKMPVDNSGSPLRMLLSMAPFLYPFWKWGKVSVQDFSERFSDPFLRKAFRSTFDLPDFSMVFVVMTLAWMNNRAAGYPIGGSLEFSRAIEKRFHDLGGKLHYRARVEKILVENNRAVGIRLEDGTEHRADQVISAADGHATIFEMLEGKYMDDEIRDRYANMPRFKSLVQVSLGVNKDMSSEPAFAHYLLDKPVRITGEDQHGFTIHNYAYDPTLAPKGKAVLVCRFMSDINNWKDLAKNKELYEAEKQKITDTVLGLVESKYPGISEQVEMADVATPITFERYTANWEGSMEGWLMTTKNFMARMKRTLPGLDNFYMLGQWLQPGGGVPTGAIMGREIIQTICKKDQRKFETSIL